jgi:Zn-dependent protease with chaperone function
MPVLAHVRAETNRRPVEYHLADQAAFNEDAQAVVNRGKGDFGIRFFGAFENLFGARMIVAVGDDVENLLALAGHAQPAGGEALSQVFVFVNVHRAQQVCRRIRRSTEDCQMTWGGSRLESTSLRSPVLLALTMNEADPIYPGGAFEGDDDSAAVVGQITVSMFSVRFETEGFTMDMPTSGLDISLDESGERVLFTHFNFRGWTVYSLDASILNHRSFQQAIFKRHVDQLKMEHSGPPKHVKRVYMALAAIALAFFGLWAGSNVILGMIVMVMPEEWEQQVGKAAFDEMSSEYKLTLDPALNNRLTLVTQRLKKGLPPDAPKFIYHVADDDLVNAFALPGGRVIVMRGLIEKATPDELAGVLAHENSHVLRKHGMRGLAQMVGPILIADYLFDGKGAVSALIAVSATFGELKYSREAETEADDKAWDILMQANIDPRGLTSFFRKLKQLEPKQSSETLSTHPATEARIQRLEKRWEESPKKSGFKPVDGGPDLNTTKN